ncbi:uncharacterized protein BJ212DRAFT_1345806 [Suillus subaureus]|uniref:C3H1-type domain-containing protein n=1 Tax=Suillus subaureus TaxID=48587 RepID=A0A9P7EE44_9AGAM|nr:uncharacterized protein BJ212DRAFT_1345806 [Suillus subaureus]KAG1818485.1 hypothetical protein BJ212DRAFT_1345806 [Suillus subaureus]
MAKASRISSNFGSDAVEQPPYIPTKEKKIQVKSSTVCRYYATRSCRRGSACRFVHLQPESVPQEYACPTENIVHTRTCHYYAAGYCRRGSACYFVHSPAESVPQEYAYPNGHEVHTKTPHKGCDQNTGHGHGYTAYATHTVVPHMAPYGFDARDAFDNSSNISLSDSTPFDQSLNAAFQVMTIEEPVSSEYLPSALSQSSPGLQYPNNTGTRCSNVAYPGYNRGYTPTGSKPRTATRRKAEQGKEKPTLYRTKPCKFFSTRKTCPGGNKCRFIHDVEKSKRTKKADSQARGTAPPHLPPKPRSLQEELKTHDYYPITWRVIGGGVMMGLPCKAFAAGYCPDGKNCRLAHETEVWTSENGAVQLKTQTSATSVAPSSSAKPSRDSSAESKHRIVCTDCSDSSRVIHSTDGGTSGSINDAEKYMSAANSNHAVPSQHRRTRSMSMPTSPSVLRAPQVSVVCVFGNSD